MGLLLVPKFVPEGLNFDQKLHPSSKHEYLFVPREAACYRGPCIRAMARCCQMYENTIPR